MDFSTNLLQKRHMKSNAKVVRSSEILKNTQLKNERTHYASLEWYRNKPPHANRETGGAYSRKHRMTPPASKKPLVSIITVVYNCRQHIEQALNSVLSQTYENVEYIVIDGGSSDGTLDVIRKYDNRIAYWMSEPDEGISDAFNKGICAAHGEIIGLLNADDWYPPEHIERGVNALLHTEADFIFGNLLVHDAFGTILYKMFGNPDYALVIHNKMSEICHPTALVRRTAYENVGLFDVSYRYAMDYEWFLRLHRAGGKGLYVKDITVNMRIGGASDVFNTRALNEVRKISVRYGETKVIADILFVFRVVKRGAKHALEKWAPWSLYHMLRKIVNPRYAGKVKH
jgi:glycosyltransferase involved in cell wall biosynthesis